MIGYLRSPVGIAERQAQEKHLEEVHCQGDRTCFKTKKPCSRPDSSPDAFFEQT